MIIGITGTLGAGKDTVAEYLKEKSFHHYPARDFITEEIKKRGFAVNRDTMTSVANDLRVTHGAGYIMESLFNAAQQEGGDAVIESIRALGELDALKKYTDFYLFAVDAHLRIRYGRIQERKSETDNVSFEIFLLHEKREMDSDDTAKQNIRGVMDRADFHIENSGTLEELYRQIENILNQITRD